MANNPDKSMKVTALRRQAEGRLRATKRDVAAMPVKDVQQLIHELQVHQIELEMQNEELRRTQGELATARDRYMALYDSAPIGYLTLGPKGMILGANLPACALMGINRKDLLGKPALRYVAAKDQAAFLRHLRKTFDSDISHVCEVDFVRPHDAPISVQFESVAAQDEAGRNTHILAALENIVERKRAEALGLEDQRGLDRQRSLEQRVGLSCDLHDGILQSLFAIGLSLETCKIDVLGNPGRAQSVLTQGVGAINSVIQEVRAFMTELRLDPVLNNALSIRDLSGALSSMAKGLARLHGQNVRVSVDNAAAAGLSQAQNLDLLKLAKEALSNSLRHAKASRVFVSLRRVNNAISLIVRDNGRGFSVEEKTGQGQGLLSMTTRAGQLGGTLSVQSMPAKGTRVVFDLPAKGRKDT
jgi:PAS domain S-box-containing protein